MNEKARSLLEKLKKGIKYNLNSEEILDIIAEIQDELKPAKVHDIKNFDLKIKLQLNLDLLGEQESPISRYDIRLLRNYIVIDEINKESFLDEVTQNYKKMIESLLEEYEGD